MRSPSTGASTPRTTRSWSSPATSTPKDIRPLVEKTFGPIPAQRAIPEKRIRPQEPTPAAPRTVTLSDPRVEQPEPAPLLSGAVGNDRGGRRSPALDVLAQLMGGGANSYLYRSLVIDKGLAISAGAGYQGTALDPSQFSISVTPKPGVEFAQIEDAIDKVIADLAQNPARAEDLERVKTQLIAEAIYAQDNQATLARWYGGALTTGLSIDDIRSWPDRIRAVTAEQVRAAAADMARQEAVGDRLSDQGYCAETRGEALVIYSLTRRAALHRLAPAPRCWRWHRRRRTPRPRSSGWCRPAASKPGSCRTRPCR